MNVHDEDQIGKDGEENWHGSFWNVNGNWELRGPYLSELTHHSHRMGRWQGRYGAGTAMNGLWHI